MHRMHGAPENALLIIRKLTSRGFEGPRNVGLRIMGSGELWDYESLVALLLGSWITRFSRCGDFAS